MDKLSKEELLDVLREYDLYIQSANDENRYSEGWFPVCINEFYDIEYQAILKDRAERQSLEEAIRNAHAGTFEYGGFHFTPYRPFYKGEADKRLEGDSRPWKMDMRYAMRNMKSDYETAMTKSNNGFTRDDFYTASSGSVCDIFRCVENGRLYVPGDNELFRYTEPPREERIAQAVKNGKVTCSTPNEDSPISAFLLGGTAFDGKNHGAWIKLPADADALRTILARTGAKDGTFSIVAAQSINGQIDALLPSTSGLDELNMLAGYLKGMEDWAINKLEAILHSGVSSRSKAP